MAADKEAERLRSVIAVLERELAGTQSIAELLREERDGLAAHVERLNSAIADWNARGEVPDNIDVLIDAAPQSSLARLKAQWQAEILEEAASSFRSRMEKPELLCMIDATFLEKRAQQLHQQAESQQ